MFKTFFPEWKRDDKKKNVTSPTESPGNLNKIVTTIK